MNYCETQTRKKEQLNDKTNLTIKKYPYLPFLQCDV